MLGQLNYWAALPEIVILVSASLILLVDLFVPEGRRHITYWLTQLALLVALCVTLATLRLTGVKGFHGLVALAQADMKKLIAYSSIAHMGFVTLGTFIAFALAREFGYDDTARLGLQGAMVQMVSHGFISGAMFSCVGVLYDRMHSRMIADYGGVVNTMPWFAALFVFFAMANAGLPGTSGFVGEFMVVIAAFQYQPLVAFAAATTLILGAAYTLWMVKRVVFGEVANAHVAALQDVNAREAWVLGVFALGALAIGLYPKPLVDLMDASLVQLVGQLATSKL
jgi:NADH-quinone oxidoreductase subunit M